MMASMATAVLAVADDEFALSAPNRYQCVEGLDARLQRLVHALALDDARRLHFHPARLGGLDGPLAIDGLTERIHHPTKKPLAHRHRGDGLRPLDGVTLAQVLVGTHHRHADVVFLEVEDQALHAARELHQLAGLSAGQPVDAGDAISDGEDGSRLGDGDLLSVVLNLLFEDSADFVGTNVHGFLGRKRARPRTTCGRGGQRRSKTPKPRASLLGC
jgi:hypothetical protein